MTRAQSNKNEIGDFISVVISETTQKISQVCIWEGRFMKLQESWAFNLRLNFGLLAID